MRPPPTPTLFPYTTLFRSYAVRAWPTLALIDPRGYVRWMGSGEGYGSALLDVVGKLVEEARQNGSLTPDVVVRDRKSTRLNSSHRCISYAVFCLKKKKQYV